MVYQLLLLLETCLRRPYAACELPPPRPNCSTYDAQMPIPVPMSMTLLGFCIGARNSSLLSVRMNIWCLRFQADLLAPPDNMVEYLGRPTRIYPAGEPHRHEEPSTRHRLTASAKWVVFLCVRAIQTYDRRDTFCCSRSDSVSGRCPKTFGYR